MVKKGTYKGHPLRSEMLEQLRYGCTYLEISRLLGIGYNVVKYHTNKAYRTKHLEITNRHHNKRINQGYYPDNIEAKLVRLIKKLKEKF